MRYILLGLSLAAPIGPVNAAQLDKGVRYGFFHAWLVGLGAMAADAVFMLLIYFGLAHFLTTPFMKTFLWSCGKESHSDGSSVSKELCSIFYNTPEEIEKALDAVNSLK